MINLRSLTDEQQVANWSSARKINSCCSQVTADGQPCSFLFNSKNQNPQPHQNPWRLSHTTNSMPRCAPSAGGVLKAVGKRGNDNLGRGNAGGPWELLPLAVLGLGRLLLGSETHGFQSCPRLLWWYLVGTHAARAKWCSSKWSLLVSYLCHLSVYLFG